MKRYKKDNDKIFITEYESLTEFMNDINSLPNNQFMKDNDSSQRKVKDNDDWYQTRDYEEAKYLLQHGWETTAQKMSAKVKLTNGAQSTVRSSRPTYGVVGSQASVPRYLQGIPTNMVSRQMIYSKQKVVTITKGISYNASFTAKQILEESIKALQIIQSMENNGQRVRMNVMLASSRGSKSSVCKVCIKQPDERLSISKMSFALAHPSMLRRFFFKWIEVDPFIDFDLGYGYGEPSRQEIKDMAMSDNEYYIPETIKDMDETIKQIQKGHKSPTDTRK